MWYNEGISRGKKCPGTGGTVRDVTTRKQVLMVEESYTNPPDQCSGKIRVKAGTSRSKPVYEACQNPATWTWKGRRYCDHHPKGPHGVSRKYIKKGGGRFKLDPYYDSKAWRELRAQVLERDKYTCQYCGEVGHQADHVLPRLHGGADDLENLVACCGRCNRTAKNSRFASFAEKQEWIKAQIKGRQETQNHCRPKLDLESAQRQ
jgi:hypothetical protein